MRDVLAAGLRWLYVIEQPAGAISQHHGVASPDIGGRRYGFCPSGVDGRAVVVVDVAHPSYLPDGSAENPLGGPAEVRELVAALATLGRLHVVTWNGHEGCTTASVALADPAHPTLRAAVDRYLAGCPVHDTVFCPSQGCSWFRDGHALLAPPSWPYTPSALVDSTQEPM